MIHTKKAAREVTFTKLITIILVALVVLWGILWMSGIGVPNWLKNIIPGIGPSSHNESNDYNFALVCPIQTARVINEKNIEICIDEKCENTRRTNIYIEDGLIKVEQNNEFDEEIGKLLRGSIVIYQEVMKGVGSKERPNLFYEAEPDLPAFEDLLNLNFAYFHTKAKLCKDFKTTEHEYRKAAAAIPINIGPRWISSGILYVNVDELIRNKRKSNIDLYLTESLNTLAKSSLDKDWHVNLRAEEGQDILTGYSGGPVSPIEKSPEHSYLSPHRMTQEGNYKKSKLIELQSPLDNTYNKIGVATGGENFEFVVFIEADNEGYIQHYIQFIDKDWPSDDELTPWIRLDYWDAYRSFARVPHWAKL